MIVVPKPLRLAGLFLGNLLAAMYGTSMADTGMATSFFHPNTIAGHMQAEDFVSAIVAFGLGYLAYYLQKSATAKWVWVFGLCWFCWGVGGLWQDHRAIRMLTGSHDLAFAGLPWSDSSPRHSESLFWLRYTVLFLRTAFYSAGAYCCSRLAKNRWSSLFANHKPTSLGLLDADPALSDHDSNAHPAPISDMRESLRADRAQDRSTQDLGRP